MTGVEAWRGKLVRERKERRKERRGKGAAWGAARGAARGGAMGGGVACSLYVVFVSCFSIREPSCSLLA
jgi:hypothetical protein